MRSAVSLILAIYLEIDVWEKSWAVLWRLAGKAELLELRFFVVR